MLFRSCEFSCYTVHLCNRRRTLSRSRPRALSCRPVPAGPCPAGRSLPASPHLSAAPIQLQSHPGALPSDLCMGLPFSCCCFGRLPGCIRSCIHSFIHSVFYPLIHSLTHSFIIHSFIQACIHSPTHALTHSLIFVFNMFCNNLVSDRKSVV